MSATTLNRTYPSEASSVPEVRHDVAELAALAGASPELIEAISLAVTEAVTNVVLHAYRWRAGRIYVTAAGVSDEFWVLIADNGCGLNSRSDTPGLGLGLLLISEETDGFTIVSRGTGGTDVRMRFDLVGLDDDQLRGSDAAAWRPASATFSTTT